jgi:hypothetical protein
MVFYHGIGACGTLACGLSIADLTPLATMLATVFLVLVTVWYAYNTHRMTRLMATEHEAAYRPYVRVSHDLLGVVSEYHDLGDGMISVSKGAVKVQVENPGRAAVRLLSANQIIYRSDDEEGLYDRLLGPRDLMPGDHLEVYPVFSELRLPDVAVGPGIGQLACVELELEYTSGTGMPGNRRVYKARVVVTFDMAQLARDSVGSEDEAWFVLSESSVETEPETSEVVTKAKTPGGKR